MYLLLTPSGFVMVSFLLCLLSLDSFAFQHIFVIHLMCFYVVPLAWLFSMPTNPKIKRKKSHPFISFFFSLRFSSDAFHSTILISPELPVHWIPNDDYFYYHHKHFLLIHLERTNFSEHHCCFQFFFFAFRFLLVYSRYHGFNVHGIWIEQVECKI